MRISSQKTHYAIFFPVGAGGLEPPTPASQTRCATELRYTPENDEYNAKMHEPSRSTFDQSLFPSLYHAHHSLHAEDIPFWLDLSRRYPAPVLELGCGTGRVLIPLALEGKWAVGLDNDFDMLRLVAEKPGSNPAHKGGVWYRRIFAPFHLATQFGLILLPCNTYSTLTGEARQAVLQPCVSII